MKKRIKNEKGSITMMALVAMLLFLMFMLTIYMLNATREQAGVKREQETKAIYGKDVDNQNEAYEGTLIGTEKAGLYSDYDIEKGVNRPVLTDGMIAVRWDVEGSEWYKVENPATDNSWYDYNNGMWANVMLQDGLIVAEDTKRILSMGSMFVWVPRYAYKIESGWHTNVAGTIGVKFLPDTNNLPLDGTDVVSIDEVYRTNGESKKYKTEKGLIKAVASGEGAAAVSKYDYVVHPSFRFGDKELTGMWVAKFEARV